MILADKIIALRKKNGWSQEELAEKMNVTRQSVSKWEGAQSVPDLTKVLQLANVFGVSTDYLLKDELEEVEYVESSEAMDSEKQVQPLRRISMEEANEFLRVKEMTAKRIALGVVLCILSPVCLIWLSVAREVGALHITENLATGVGMIALFLLVAIAVAIFISSGSMTGSFAYLETEVFETEYGVSGMIKERQKQYRDIYTKCNALGACSCILSLVPLFTGMIVSEEELFIASMLVLMFVLIGVGVFFFVTAGIQWESMEKLLQEGDYTKRKKKVRSVGKVIAPIYWPIVVAIYLTCIFVLEDYAYSWVIWPIAGVLYAALINAVEALRKNK